MILKEKSNTRRKIIKVLVIAAKDDRNRYQFLTEPFKRIKNVQMELVLKTKSYLIFFPNLILKSLKFRPDLIIAIEADLIGFSAVLISKLILHKPVVERTGGDSITPRLNMFKKFPLFKITTPLKHNLHVWKQRILHLFTTYTFSNCSYFIVVSNHYAHHLGKLINLRGRKIFVVPQYCIVKTSDSRRGFLRPDCIHLLTVTNLNNEAKYKGIRELVRFVQRYVNKGFLKNSKFVFDICGDGYFYNRLLNDINSMNSEKSNLSIRCHGYVQKLCQFYNSADLFIYASYFDALPNVLLEAQSYGLPILLNNYQGFQEFITDHWNGVFYKSGNFENFAKKLTELITDSNLRQFLSDNAIKNIRENYSPESIALKLKKAINEILQDVEGSLA